MSFTKKILIAAVAVAALFLLLLRFTPVRGLGDFTEAPYSLPLYSRSGRLISILPLEEGLRREYLPIDRLSDEQIDIILDSEDRRFFFHPGFDLPALLRASWQLVQSGEIQSGGSTVTMQLSGLIDPREGLGGKVYEIFNAMRLETRFSKKEILELYINRIPFGSNVEGLQSAARYFFGKEAPELEGEELLILMMIPRRPEDFNPLKNPEANREALLRTAGRLSRPISEDKLDQLYTVLETHEPRWPALYPHFALMVRSSLTDEQWQSGKAVHTSLDDRFQEAAQSYLKETLDQTERNRISNGAIFAIDNGSGQILAYVGSVDFYNDSLNGQIDGVRIRRQPGSTLKPFLYGKALEQGFGPSSPLPDIPMEFGSSEIYTPENYNERYNGPVRFSVALGSSLNVPAVYLLERVGVRPFVDKLTAAGFHSLSGAEGLGVGLALGNGEVTLWELVQGFSLFSREGRSIPLSFESDSTELEGSQVYREEAAQMIRHILSDNRNRILGFGRSNPLEVPFEAAFKTGTSNQFNNIWALGSTQDLTVGVWMGNFSGETVIGSPGSSYPARIVVSLLEDFRKVDRYEEENAFVTKEICSLSGRIAGPHCPYTLDQAFPLEEEPGACDWHSPSGVVLPAEYGRWVSLYHQDYEIAPAVEAVSILQPRDGAIFYLDPTLPEDSQEIPVRILGRREVSLYINDTEVLRKQAPFTYYHKVEPGVLSIRAVSGRYSDSALVKVR